MATLAQKRVNLAVSRIIPPVLLGVVTYASYAVTKPLCSEWWDLLWKGASTDPGRKTQLTISSTHYPLTTEALESAPAPQSSLSITFSSF